MKRLSLQFAELMEALGAMFRPPFIGFPLIIWLYFCWCFLFHPESQIIRGIFPDSDDYMYLVQVLDWLQGQSWFDIIQHRMSPPDGVAIHFSRLAQLPMAALILPFHWLGLPWTGAATVTAIIYPPMLLLVLFELLRRVGRNFLPEEWTRFAAFIALFSGTLLYQFTPGHVDHHGLEALLMLLSFGNIVRMMREPQQIKWAVASAVTLALGLVVALEILPVLLALTAALGVWMMVVGRYAARSGLVFGVTFYLATVLGLLSYKSPDHWFDIDILAYSIVYVLLAGCIALSYVSVALASQSRLNWLRYVAGSVTASVLAVVFFQNFPDLINGPYGAMNQDLAKIFFHNLEEAVPMLVTHSFFAIVLRLAPPLLALFSCYLAVKQYRGEMRWLFIFTAYLIIIPSALATFYQIRFLVFSHLFSVIPLVWLLHNGLQGIAKNHEGRRRFWLEILLVMALGPLPVIIIPSLANNQSLSHVFMFPMQTGPDMCDTAKLEMTLKLPFLQGNKPYTIMNMMDTGPEILFRSRHNVVAAPFHMNVQGNLDAVKFFSTTNSDEALQILQRNHADLIVMCRIFPGMYASGKPEFERTMIDGRRAQPDHLELMPKDGGLAIKLLYRQLPNWLQYIDIQGLDNYMIFRIRPGFKG